MAELLDDIRKEMNARLTELGPLVDEFHRLEAALKALDAGARNAASNGGAAGGSAPGRRGGRSNATPASGARKRAARGANRRAVLGLVGDRPGISSAELVARSGVERNTLYALLTRLVKDGELRKLVLPTGRPGYALADQPAAAPAGGDE